MKTKIFILFIFISFISCQKEAIKGDLKEWSKITIDFQGPQLDERSNPNPFTDFRMDVEFTSPSGMVYKVPGYFAASGDAGETSTSEGNIWRVNFTPGEIGKWSYKAYFVKGKNIAAQLTGGEKAGYFHGAKGKFEVLEGDFSDDKDFRKQGKLVYTGEHYMQFSKSKNYFLKAGANSPEVLLEYQEFDNTPSTRLYPAHIKEWTDGDPLWQEEKGKGIIGMMNYLSSLDINAYYFLSMNAYGDGKKAWPWVHQDSIFRYDCSKLDQWGILFDHMNRKGILVNMILTETENEAFFEEMEYGKPEGFADSHKIYFREMVARYGYLNAITYSIGEENGWEDPRKFQKANTDDQRKEFADYLRALTYYDDFIGVHNGPSWDKHIYPALYGHKSYSGPSFQWDFGKNIYHEILSLRQKSDSAGHKWVVNLDEPYVDPPKRDLNEWRIENVWPVFMAGGAGIELYIGAGLDVKEQDLHPYKKHYQTMVTAVDFFTKHVPFYEMEPVDGYTALGHTLRKNNDLFVFYFKSAENIQVNLPQYTYSIQWFDPIKGGELQNGSLDAIAGGSDVSIGQPPHDANQDWVCIVKRK